MALICAAVVGCSQKKTPAPQSASPAPTVPAPTAPQIPQTPDANGTPARIARPVPGEYFVKFRNSDRVRALSALSETSFQPVRTFRNLPNLYLVKLTESADGQRAYAALAQRNDVEYLEPNFYVHSSATPNDPRFFDQWGLLSPSSLGGNPGADIDATAAWDFTTGSSNVVIAVLDSGIDYSHEDLAANIFSNPLDCNADGLDSDSNGYIDDCHGIDVVDHDSSPMDPDGHGTHVAGIIGAQGNNGIGISGVAWQVRLLPCRFLDASGEGTNAGAIECLDYIASLRQAGVNIVASNNSWGNPVASRALQDAIRRQQQAGILFVAAAGNDRVDVDQEPEYPCSSDVLNILCIAGSNLNDATFYNWGKATVLVQAPGANIWSTYPGNTYKLLGGTSMATPHVSGVIALLAAQNPARDWRALRNLVFAGADAHTGAFPLTNAPHLNAATSVTCLNRTAIKRLKPAALETMLRPVGAQIVLSVLNVNCASPAGLVSVTINETGNSFFLSDNGTIPDEVAGDGVYTGSWTVPAAGEYTLSVLGISGESIRVKGMAELKPGFPVSLDVDTDRSSWIGGLGHAITIGNVTGDAHPEIIAPGLLQGPLYAWDHTGTSLPGWPSYESYRASLPSLGELDGDDTHKEIVADFRYGGLRRLSTLGTTLSGWNKVGAAWSAPMADLDGDGRDEIISNTTYYADGSLFSSVAGIPATAGLDGIGPPVVADLDGDGRPDVITGGTDSVWAVNQNGVLPGFPFTRTGEVGSWPRLVAGDVDGDGEPEIVLTHIERLDSSSPMFGFVQIYSNRGVLERRIALGDVALGIGEPVLADLDSDGIPELIVSGGRSVFAYKGNGTLLPGWPWVVPADEALDGLDASVLVGDITGDGHPDVTVMGINHVFVAGDGWGETRTSFLYAIERNGALAAGFPKSMTSAHESSASRAIADVDLDGRNEIFVVSPSGYGYREALFAWDFSTGPGGPIEWGQYRGGADRKGFYELGKNLAGHAFLTAHSQGRGTISGNGINCGSDCIEKYPKGTTVLLTATPASGAMFQGWTGACSGMSTTCSVVVNRQVSATARFTSIVSVQFSGSGSGSVSSTPAGINCSANCSQTFSGGSAISLVATPASGTDFDGWSGACTGFSTTCRLAADGSMQVTASFTSGYRLFVTKLGESGGSVTSSAAGINCGSTCSAVFARGSQVVLTATPDPGFYVGNWNSACLSNISTPEQCTATMDASKSVTVLFVPKKKIVVQLAGNGGGTISSTPGGISCVGQTCTILAKNGENVQLQAQPNGDSEFTGWGGQCSGFSLTCSVSPFNADVAVTADFTLRSSLQQLQVATAGDSGIGKVTSSIGGINCGLSSTACSAYLATNASVTLTAVWGATGTFTGWSGACSGSASTCTVTMGSARSVTATFASNTPPQTLTVVVAGDSSMGKVMSSPASIDCGQGAASCSATLPFNTVVTLTATAAANGVFTGWSGNCGGTATTCLVAMSAARNVTATFAAATPVMQTLNVTVAGDNAMGRITTSTGGINCGLGSTACSASIATGTSVTLTATPAANGVFGGWTGDCTGAASICVVSVNAATNVTATFTASNPPPVTHLIQVAVAGGGTGKVTSSTGGINCGMGSVTCSAAVLASSTVILTATPGSNSSLGGWSGDCSGASATCTISMGAAKSATATFNVVSSPPPSSGGSGGGGGLDRQTLLGLLALLFVLQSRLRKTSTKRLS